MRIPVLFDCICGTKHVEHWFDFSSRNLSETQTFLIKCGHENPPQGLSKTFVVIIKNMFFRAHSIAGLPEELMVDKT